MSFWNLFHQFTAASKKNDARIKELDHQIERAKTISEELEHQLDQACTILATVRPLDVMESHEDLTVGECAERWRSLIEELVKSVSSSS